VDKLLKTVLLRPLEILDVVLLDNWVLPIRDDVEMALHGPGKMDYKRILEAWVLYSRSLGDAMQVWLGGGVWVWWGLISLNCVGGIFCILIGLLGCALLFGVWVLISVILLIGTLKTEFEGEAVGDRKVVLE
jgi:hypothetical protein